MRIQSSVLTAKIRILDACHVFSINLFIWLGICTIGAAGNYQDLVKEGRRLDFYRLWLSWVDEHVPLVIFSTALFITLRRRVSLIDSSPKIARLYLLLAVGFYPLHMFYNAASRTLRQAEIFTINNWLHSLAQYDHFSWFLEFAWFTGTFAVATAVCIWHQGQDRAAALQRTETANLNLHLALEQQRLRSIRQQLEPHFIFNALNAISALVRLNENPVAVSAIRQLSDLLRYTLKGSSKDWITLGEELRFVGDYVALQKLRYGERLRVEIYGVNDAITHCDCPPFLLQPLIENALRHDLDCHEGHCTILLQFTLQSENLHIHLSNTLGELPAENSGLGMGLNQTNTRLNLLYGGQASLHTHKTKDHFKLDIHMPLHRPDSEA